MFGRREIDRWWKDPWDDMELPKTWEDIKIKYEPIPPEREEG